MKVSVVISVCKGRYDLFSRSLDTWGKQTLNKDDFELVIVDDNNIPEYKKLCEQKSKEYGLQIQYAVIDNRKCAVPVTTFIPVLSNNVGMRISNGEVIVITGPETLQAENNLEVAQTMAARKICAYGLVWKSNREFVQNINENWADLKNERFKKTLDLSGAKVECLTRPPHPPAYWYFLAVAKKHVEKIHGVDERFAQGICAEDDDFANRMRMAGVTPTFEHSIVGIHQNHSQHDLGDKEHNFRKEARGLNLQRRNRALMKDNLNKRRMIVNPDHTWGNKNVIIEHNEWRNL